MQIYRQPPVLKGAASTQAEVTQRLSVQIRESHCNKLPESQLPAMLAVQQQRDRTMAQVVFDAPKPALLIAGAYHARYDFGVPLHLQDLHAAAGVQTVVALPFNNLLRTLWASRLDLRNHRKITVVDARITYCGSRNSADPEFLVKEKYGPWIDIMLRFEGPVVAQNQLLFASDWMQATGEALEVIPLQAQPITGGFPAQVMGVGPTERRGATPQLFSNLFACAERELTLTTPYFVPDATVLDALCAAAYRGVAVTLVFPKVNDSWIVAAASRSYYHRLLDAGCVIYEHRTGLLHAKTLTVDGQVSLIGSSNLDLRSFDLNYENNILLQDEAITQAIVKRQRHYIAGADRVLLPQVLAWRYHRRIWHNVIATIGPVL